jgi:hypothetical protein
MTHEQATTSRVADPDSYYFLKRDSDTDPPFFIVKRWFRIRIKLI